MKLIAKVVKYAVLVSLAVSLISLSESVKNGCRGAINAAGDAADAVIAAFDEVTDITVREYDNKIGLFRDGEDDPFYVINVPVFTLPEADRKMLEDGFRVASDKIYEVIEDFSG